MEWTASGGKTDCTNCPMDKDKPCHVNLHLAALNRIKQLESENAELKKQQDEIQLYSFSMKSGEVNMRLGSSHFDLIISALAQMIEQNGAKNFLTTAVEIDASKYSVTVQKTGGVTPSETITQLREENAELREKLDKAIEIPFKVIDKQTGKEADIYNIALNEEWAKHLIYCDMEGFAVEQDGSLILLDECSNVAYPPADRFEIISENQALEQNAEEDENE